MTEAMAMRVDPANAEQALLYVPRTGLAGPVIPDGEVA